MTVRGMLVTSRYTYTDDKYGPTPARILELGIAAFFQAVASIMGGSGTLLLGGVVARGLGLPAGTDNMPTGPDAKQHPAAQALRDAGWRMSSIGRWWSMSRGTSKGTQTINVGLLEYIDHAYCTILGDRAYKTTGAMAEWQRLMGVPWYGAAGDALNAVVRATGRLKIKGKSTEPAWWSHTGPDGDPREAPYYPSSWRRDATEDHAYLICFDRCRAYLGAMMCTDVAAFGLRRKHAIPFDRGQSGWWLARVADWRHPELMPDPAGYGPTTPDGLRWLTTPTLSLVDDLAQSGKHGGFEIVDSWLSVSKSDILKPAATLYRKAWDELDGYNTATAGLIRDSIKEGYRQGHTFWIRNKASEIQRADWSAAWIATNRCNGWRKAWEIGQKTGYWPVKWDTDAMWYPSITDDHAKIASLFRRALDRGDGRDRFAFADSGSGVLGGWRANGVRSRGDDADVSRETVAA